MLVTDSEVQRHLAAWAADEIHRLPDTVARTLASWWYSPNPADAGLSRLAHGQAVSRDDLLAAIGRHQDVSGVELLALRHWALTGPDRIPGARPSRVPQ